MIVDQSNRLPEEFIDAGRLQYRISMTTQIAVALIVRDDDDHVGMLGIFGLCISGQPCKANKHQTDNSGGFHRLQSPERVSHRIRGRCPVVDFIDW